MSVDVRESFNSDDYKNKYTEASQGKYRADRERQMRDRKQKRNEGRLLKKTSHEDVTRDSRIR